MRNTLIVIALAALSALTLPPATASAAMDDMAPAPAMTTIPQTTGDWARGAMLFDGLAKVHRPVVTSSPLAQRYFDQGMSLMWGFNHDEATRSFARAAQIDPHCAACFWGVSFTVGPNYNLLFLSAPRAKVAFEALGRARAEAAHGSPVEQALIGALAKRYPGASALDPDATLPVLAVYSDAMREVAHRFPDDLDVQVLYAESLMDLHAWKLWGADGTPAPGTLEVVARLESVLARDPGHVGANHYYVHALEQSPHPEKALAAAAVLATVAPAEGHLAHMPAHILQRVGRYEEAAEANRLGAAADLAYVGRTTPPDYYISMYGGHNYQFLAYSTAMEGRRAETIHAVDRSRAITPDAMLVEMQGGAWYVAESYLARVRFGLWDDLLAMPQPDRRLPGLTGGWLYGRGMALAAKGKVGEARETLAELKSLADGLSPDPGAGQNALKDVLAVATAMVEGRIAQAGGRTNDEIAALRGAVAAEDKLTYDEPRNWLAPTRQSLGAALLRANDPRGAEQVYREDLKQNPDNGWSLFGLAAALRAQGRIEEAKATTAAFTKAWRLADVTLTASAY